MKKIEQKLKERAQSSDSEISPVKEDSEEEI